MSINVKFHEQNSNCLHGIAWAENARRVAAALIENELHNHAYN